MPIAGRRGRARAGARTCPEWACGGTAAASEIWRPATRGRSLRWCAAESRICPGPPARSPESNPCEPMRDAVKEETCRRVLATVGALRDLDAPWMRATLRGYREAARAVLRPAGRHRLPAQLNAARKNHASFYFMAMVSIMACADIPRKETRACKNLLRQRLY